MAIIWTPSTTEPKRSEGQWLVPTEEDSGVEGDPKPKPEVEGILEPAHESETVEVAGAPKLDAP